MARQFTSFNFPLAAVHFTSQRYTRNMNPYNKYATVCDNIHQALSSSRKLLVHWSTCLEQDVYCK
jgi:hypothetical protein